MASSELLTKQELALTWEIILCIRYIGNYKFIYWQVSEFLTHLDWKVWFAYSNFSDKNDVILLANFNGKNDVILLKSSAFRRLQALRINFLVHFLTYHIYIKRTFTKLSHFFLLLAVFEKSVNISHQDLSFNHIVKECLISKNLHIIRKKTNTFWPAFIRVVPLKILKRYCNDLELAKCNTLQLLEETRQPALLL